MTPLIIAGSVAGVLTLIDWSNPGQVVERASAGAPEAIAKCNARATAAAAPQDTLEQAQAVLRTLIQLADAGRSSGAYSYAIDEDLGTAKDQLAGAANTFFSPDLNDTHDAISQLALVMDADCAINSVAGGFFSSQDSLLTTVEKGIVGARDATLDGTWGGASYVVRGTAKAIVGGVKSLVNAIVPEWVWYVLVAGGFVVGGLYLVQLGVLHV